MILSALLLFCLHSPVRAQEPAVEKSTAAHVVLPALDMTACFVAGASEKNALTELRFMSSFSERSSSFHAEKFFQTKVEYTPKAGGCDISVRVSASEDGAAAEAFSSRSGKLLFIERQDTISRDSGGALYQAIAARLRKEPDVLSKSDGTPAAKPQLKPESKPDEKPIPEIPPQPAAPTPAPATPAPAQPAPAQTEPAKDDGNPWYSQPPAPAPDSPKP